MYVDHYSKVENRVHKRSNSYMYFRSSSPHIATHSFSPTKVSRIFVRPSACEHAPCFCYYSQILRSCQLLRVHAYAPWSSYDRQPRRRQRLDESDRRTPFQLWQQTSGHWSTDSDRRQSSQVNQCPYHCPRIDTKVDWYRMWRQNGPKARTGALFLAVSMTEDLTKHHKTVHDGYNRGR
jgi:hypothetical protein